MSRSISFAAKYPEPPFGLNTSEKTAVLLECLNWLASPKPNQIPLSEPDHPPQLLPPPPRRHGRQCEYQTSRSRPAKQGQVRRVKTPAPAPTLGRENDASRNEEVLCFVLAALSTTYTSKQAPRSRQKTAPLLPRRATIHV